jgi:hypothetical protein
LQLVELLRDSMTAVKGKVVVVTSAQLNGAVTKTLKKCGHNDQKQSIAAFKVSPSVCQSVNPSIHQRTSISYISFSGITPQTLFIVFILF